MNFRGQRAVNVTASQHARKTILLWTKYFETDTWATNEYTFSACPVQSCTITKDRGRLREAHAVMMNVRDFSEPSELPPVHLIWQVWILHGSEPPYYIWQDLGRYGNVFNWTSWYRADADIFSPYVTYTAKTKPGEREEVSDVFGLHDKLVYWAASNCYDLGRRYTRVGALSKYLQVDTYGSCGNHVCHKGSPHCLKQLSRYKFVLSFENGYCRDYITEKLWNAYSRQQIPIVSGGADYSKLAIPGSYIDYDNFATVEELANFIKRVGSDRNLYNSFFQWRTKYSVKYSGVANWCQICEALHDKERPPQVYRDVRAWAAEDSCQLYAGVRQFITADFYYGFYKFFGV